MSHEVQLVELSGTLVCIEDAILSLLHVHVLEDKISSNEKCLRKCFRNCFLVLGIKKCPVIL